MQYRAVGNRCAIDLSSIPLDPTLSKQLLEDLGFTFIDIDLVAIARSRIGVSAYQRCTPYENAPDVVDCSSFIKWLWSIRGVWVPRLSIQQSMFGTEVDPLNLQADDVLFTTGCVNFFHDNPAQGIGHVGLYTGEGTVVHAAGKKWGVKEHKISSFLRGREPRGVRRFVMPETLTVEVPSSRSVDWSDDLKWMLLRQTRKLDHL